MDAHKIDEFPGPNFFKRLAQIEQLERDKPVKRDVISLALYLLYRMASLGTIANPSLGLSEEGGLDVFWNDFGVYTSVLPDLTLEIYIRGGALIETADLETAAIMLHSKVSLRQDCYSSTKETV
jgi:hypothetical protein